MSFSVFDTKKVIDVIKYRWVWLILSACLLLPGIIAMFVSVAKYPTHTPLLVGIDFTGGTIVQYSVNDSVPPEKLTQVREKLVENKIDNPVLQVLKPTSVDTNASDYHILSVKTQFSEEDQSELVDRLTNAINQVYPQAQMVQTNSVGPVLGKQLFVNSLMAMGLALLCIVMYLTVRFRFDYAFTSCLKLLHDVVFVVGVFSLLGLFCGVQIDSLFVTAILTVLGYSINDTIVVFDRIRENVKFYSNKATFGELVNVSVNQSLARSINTSLTTLITLGALYFFGGVTTKDFVLVMILGVIIGTYSSLFFASTLIALWNEKKDKSRND